MKTLLTLGKKKWTGCLRVIDRSTGESAGVYLYNGDLYAVEIDGFRPDLGLRLGAAGILTAERLSLLKAQYQFQSGRHPLAGSSSISSGSR